MKKLLAACAVLAFAVPAATALEDRKLILPADYKTAFDNYYVAGRYIQEDQVISLYANSTARQAARAGAPLPDGSVIVGEIYSAKKDDAGEVLQSALGRRVADELKAIVVMERQSAWGDQYPEGLKVGGWEFEVFSPSGQNLAKDTTACRECHEPHGDTEYLFSIEHMAATN